jgi:dephospho-CoA kinase
MLKIGITGGIGSGKSTICKIFSALKIPVYNADIAAAILTHKSLEVKTQMISAFGEDIYEDGYLNRKKLAGIIFQDKSELEKVNSIIHPAVKIDYEKWVIINKSEFYTIKEAAILFESGANKQVDKVITVFAPIDLRIKRVILRENISEAEVLKRINSQMPEEEKLQKSDFIIYNDESQSVVFQVLKIHNILINNIL